ncbi:GPI mannosyltransferase [Radiomyces spectabilis]|uniref:GPI mannosyltransferase n=1 Tax=Radiomyces spectabilis TaxID=64574 RepID=UPI00221FBA7C|nr:GPI mannosyltransferase [Radiomyces spectabilis]KAI8374420.1 GPI mannosyltransferase [Radiomyces spectabilis]
MKTLYVILYVGLLWLRWMASSLPGYVHPDEYCQSPEITAGSVFNIETFTPWEYQPQHAARSIVIPYLVTGIPFCLLRFIEAVTGTWHEVPETLVIFLVQRTACFLFSILIDYSVISVCRYLKQGIVLPLFLVATSQVMLVYYIRPFSNSAEAIILGLSLVVYTKLWQKVTA